MGNDQYKIPNWCDAAIIFKNGKTIFGKGFGQFGIRYGEICFNTGMTGYQESITDPSYYNQIINFTFPHIGNVGVNKDDMESNKIYAKGIITRNMPSIDSNYRSESNFIDWMKSNNLFGICNVDTRAITRFIRDNGSQMVAMVYSEDLNNNIIKEAYEQLLPMPEMESMELASQVSTKEIYKWHFEQDNAYNVVVIDFGVKHNILRCLKDMGDCNIIVVPMNSSFEEVMKLAPSAIFLSNGPGDPSESFKICGDLISRLINESGIPIFGICMGHQILALSLGASTYHMKQGHRGANQPVLNIQSNKVEITSQNHGFAVDEFTLPKNAVVTHKSLFDGSVEGFEIIPNSRLNETYDTIGEDAQHTNMSEPCKNRLDHLGKQIFSVQYHPESSPGPDDSKYLFKKFKSTFAM